MLSFEFEYGELRAAGVIDDAAAAQGIAAERGTIFSVSEELRVSLYAAVAAITTGVGIFLKANLHRIGPSSLIVALALAAAACYATAVRSRLRRETRSAAGEYVLLLGALLVSADLGYAESQFHWLDSHWSLHLLILFFLHAVTAYVLNSRLVLSVSITLLAAWFGIEGNFVKSFALGYALSEAGIRAVLCGSVIFVWREIDRRLSATRLFQETFEHFAANLGFWGALALCLGPRRFLGAVCLGALALVTIRHGLQTSREIFVIYGVGYTTLGLFCLEVQLIGYGVLAAITALATVVGAVTLMWQLHRAIRAAAP